MSTPEHPTQPTLAATTPAAPAPRRRTGLVVAGVIAALAIGGVAVAQSFGGHPFPGGFMRHGGPMGFGMMDPAAMEDRADRAIRHLAIEIDATAEQQEKLRGITRALVKDLDPLRNARIETARRARSLLTGAAVDAAEVEKFRAEQVAKIDAATRRVAQALVEAANVLTAEQRRKIDDRLPRPGAGPFWRRG